MNQIRHGDVFLMRVPAPAGEAPAVCEQEIVLAAGETTGHAHRIRGLLAQTRTDGAEEIVVASPAPLSHEDHGTIIVPPGWYEIRHQGTLLRERVRD